MCDPHGSLLDKVLRLINALPVETRKAVAHEICAVLVTIITEESMR